MKNWMKLFALFILLFSFTVPAMAAGACCGGNNPCCEDNAPCCQ